MTHLGRGTLTWVRLETRFGGGFKPFGNQVSIHVVFTERCVYIQWLLHREGPSHRDGFTQRDDFTKACFYLQVLLHRDAFNTEMLLHTGALRYKYFYAAMILLTQVPLRRDACTHVFLHVNTSTVHSAFCTHSFTLRFLYTQTLLHRGTLTHSGRHVYLQILLHGGVHFARVFFTCTHALSQGCLWSHMLLHRDIFARRRRGTERMLFYTNTFTERWFHTEQFYTETKTSRGAFSKECVCTKGF